MSESKTPLSQAQTDLEIGEFWDEHDLADYWEQTEEVDFEIDIQSEGWYFALDSKLSAQVDKLAWQRGISAETLINLWVKDKLQEIEAEGDRSA